MNTYCGTLSTSDKLKTNQLKNTCLSFYLLKILLVIKICQALYVQGRISDNVTGYKIKERINNTHIL